jgi:hypothetical protein
MPFASVPLPPAQAGYWRGGTDWPETQGAGPAVPLTTNSIPYWNSQAAPGYGSAPSSSPTIGYIVVLTLVELVVFHNLSDFLKI